MDAGSDKAPSRGTLLPLQIMVAALATGPLLFLILLLMFGFGPAAGAPRLGDFMTYTAVGIAIVAGLANITLSIVLNNMAHRHPRRAFELFSYRTIGGAACFTFATFFAAVALMLEQSMAALLLAMCLILAVVSRFPTRAIAARWVRPIEPD